MKCKVTEKALKAEYIRIITAPADSLHYLLYFRNPAYFTAGVYGWNADIYDIDGVAISTGYRANGNMKADFKTIELFEKTAEKLITEMRFNYSDELYNKTKSRVNHLLFDFIGTVAGGSDASI